MLVVRSRSNKLRRRSRLASVSLAALCLAAGIHGALAEDDSEGKAILERNCGRCHAVVPDSMSPLKEAPNLWIVLGSYPAERLEVELGEGIGSRHREMPQIQFSEEDIWSIYYYLHGKQPDAESRPPQ
jgi:mono/diheme cytochrome c family protein